MLFFFFFSSRRRHTRLQGDWSSDVCSSDLKRAREAVQQHADLARLSRELVTIKRDVPLPLDLDRLRVRPPDVARLTELFTELEFRSLIPKLASLEPAATARSEERTSELQSPCNLVCRLLLEKKKK